MAFFKKLFSVFTKPERKMLVATTVIGVVALIAAISTFVAQTTKTVPAAGGDFTEGIAGQPEYVNPVTAQRPADRALVKLIYANFDRDEVFTYFEGDQQKARTLAAERVQDIDMNVRLLLTRFKQRESVESGQKALDAYTLFAKLPPQMQGQAAPLFIQIGKGLGIEQADTIFAPMALPPALPPGQPPEQGANVIPMEPQPNAAAAAGLPGMPAAQ